MALVELTASVIDDGRAMDALQAGLNRISKDVMDRPGIKGARKVTLEISIAPYLDDQMQNMPAIHASVSWKVPAWKGESTFGKVEDGKILVNPWDGNPNQGLLLFADSEKGGLEELPAGDADEA